MFRDTVTFEGHQCGHDHVGGPAVDVKQPQPLAGFGACSASGCICQAYSGNGPLCENCTHNYADHW